MNANAARQLLSWEQLDCTDTVNQAIRCVESFLAKGDYSKLGECSLLVKQIREQFIASDLDSIPFLADEIIHLCDALAQKSVESHEDACQALLASLIHFPDYLSAIVLHQKQNLSLLLSVINDMRSVRGEDLFLQSQHFKIDCHQAFSFTLLSESIDKALILAAQKCLAQYIENKQDNGAVASINQLTQSVDVIEKALADLSASDNAPLIDLEIARLFLVLLNDLTLNGDSLDLCEKYTLRRWLQSLYGDTATLESQQQILNELLFSLALKSSAQQSLSTAKSQYALNEAFVACDSEQIIVPSAPDLQTIRAMYQSLSSDIEKLKSAIEDVIAQNEYALSFEALTSLANAIQLTFQVIKRDDLSREMALVVKQLTSQSGIEDQDAFYQSIADSLYKIESALHKEQSNGLRDQSELAAIEQIRQTLNKVKYAIEFVAESAASKVSDQSVESLIEAERHIQDLVAISSMLNFSDASAVFSVFEQSLSRLCKVVQASCDADETPSQAICESLVNCVDNINQLDFYFQAARYEAFNDAENILGNVEKQFSQYACIESSQSPAPEVENNAAAIEADGQGAGGNADVSDITESTSVDALNGDAQALEGEFDEEIVEIFLEEAEEVIEELSCEFEKWQAKDTDTIVEQQALAIIRRGFHTLKGSGRMAGAEHLGDAAWAAEGLLNNILDDTLILQPAHKQFIAEAIQYLPSLVNSFEQRLVPELNALTSFINKANALAAGEAIGDIVDEHVDIQDAPIQVATVEVLSDLDGEQAQAEETVETSESSIEAEKASEADLVDTLEPVLEEPVLEEDAADQVEPEHIDSLAEVEASDSSDACEDEALLPIFLDEVKQQLSIFTAFIEAAAKEPIAPSEELLRSLHTIVGSARVAGAKEMANLVASLEALILQSAHDEVINENVLQALVKIEALLNETVTSGQADCDAVVAAAIIETIHQAQHSATPLVDSPDLEEALEGIELINSAPQLIRQWRLAGVVPEGLSEIIETLESLVSSANGEASPIDRMAEALLSAYAFFVKNGLSVHASRALLACHENLENYLDQAAVNPALSYDSNDILQARDDLLQLIEQEESFIESNNQQAITSSTSDSHEVSEADREIIGIFLEESEDLLEEIEADFMQWIDAPHEELFSNNLLRALHTIKGGARMADLNAIGDTCHEFETTIQDVDKVELLDQTFFNRIEGFVKQLKEAVNDVKDSQHNAITCDAASADVRLEAPKQVEMVRVPADLLEQLVNLAGETSISRSLVGEKVNEFTRHIEEVDTTIERLKEQLRRLEIETEAQISFRKEQVEMEGLDDFDPLEMDRYSQLQQLSKSLVESASDLKDLKSTLTEEIRDTETLLLQQARINTELQEGLMKTRTISVSKMMVPRLRRTVKQVSAELEKPVNFKVLNAKGELDRSILEKLISPLEHIVRNALDHGIEPSKQRVKLGKPELGTICMNVSREGGEILLKLSDDGRGIDVDAVKKKAQAKGLIKEGAKLSDEEVVRFIFAPELSTASTVTKISGRGVGMDAVLNEITELGGSISVETSAGKGTTFHIRFPFTVSMNRALLVNAANEMLAIPLETIEGIVRVNPYELEQYHSDENNDFYYAGQRYEFAYLGSYINGQPYQASQDMITAVPLLLVRSGDKFKAIQVDKLLGSREIVVKSLGGKFAGLNGISGATVLGDGSVVMIIDLPGLISSDHHLIAKNTERTETQGHVIKALVVDDSVTVRKVTSRLLERNGIEVMTAKDGVDALEQLDVQKPDFILLDIEMPRMDGFEMVSRVRHDESIADVPIIMISSRTGDKHRQRALELGANYFLGKPYQEAQLFEAINESSAIQIEQRGE